MRLHAHVIAAAMGAGAVLILAVILGCGDNPPPTPETPAAAAGKVGAPAEAGQATQPAAPAAPPAPQCTKDADCSGKQICRDGACHTPR